ncbi:hypothetical protein CSKR_113500 [Clonorchis sinensis]|uniref:Uncharacterized protein n=1 Tax=Clonorchis sinensis TaxID=79923 RepID=A0A419PGQ6_CLOSI|nr:hypothetical protein CSKR_113500 [Clonorchis sinensis]
MNLNSSFSSHAPKKSPLLKTEKFTKIIVNLTVIQAGHIPVAEWKIHFLFASLENRRHQPTRAVNLRQWLSRSRLSSAARTGQVSRPYNKTACTVACYTRPFRFRDITP